MPKTAERARDRLHRAIAGLWTRRGPPGCSIVRPANDVVAAMQRGMRVMAVDIVYARYDRSVVVGGRRLRSIWMSR
jgi:hypothetical protein